MASMRGFGFKNRNFGGFFPGKEASKTIFGPQWPRLRHNLGLYSFRAPFFIGKEIIRTKGEITNTYPLSPSPTDAKMEGRGGDKRVIGRVWPEPGGAPEAEGQQIGATIKGRRGSKFSIFKDERCGKMDAEEGVKIAPY